MVFIVGTKDMHLSMGTAQVRWQAGCNNMPHFITIRQSPSTCPAPSRSFYTLVTTPDYNPNLCNRGPERTSARVRTFRLLKSVPHVHDEDPWARSVCLTRMYYLTGTVSAGTSNGTRSNARSHSIFCIRYTALRSLVTPCVE